MANRVSMRDAIRAREETSLSCCISVELNTVNVSIRSFRLKQICGCGVFHQALA